MELNQIFRSHMVLQANKPINIFGTGDGTVKVEINGRFVEANVSGNWVVALPASDYSGPHFMKVTMNEETVVLHDIYFGDVLLIAGQSNVQFKLGESTVDKNDYESNDMIRLYSPDRPEKNEHFTPKDGWVILDTETAEHWTAIGYHTALEINKKTGHAIGVVTCYQGSSAIQSWVPLEALINTHAYIPFEDRRHQFFWNDAGYNYNYIFKTFVPFAFKAVVWYQGESNTFIKEADDYHFMLTTLINWWRNDLKDKKLPFVVVQIADWDAIIDQKLEYWKIVQAAQMRISETMENVYSVKCADVCENDCVHPPTKIHLSKRIVEKILEN